MIILFLIHIASGAVTTQAFSSYDACSKAYASVNSAAPGQYTAACTPQQYKAPRTGYLGQ